jgi:serine/threonine protein kinase
MEQPSTEIGPYRLLNRLGAGGMGEVWKAEDTRLGRMVAIKFLPEKIAADPEAIARMRREARTAAQLSHPNIATIHSFEEVGGRLFIVMELVDGEPLSRMIQRAKVDETEACRIARDVADALGEAHARGIIHRDIKPDNIMISENRVKVLDFGIARQIEVEGIQSEDPTAFLTQQGTIIGTVQYMSPEQALGKSLDARTDVFSLGVVLYEAMSGKLPFRGDSATETITRIVRDEPPALEGVSKETSSIVRRCLAKDRESRFGTARELRAALDAHLARLPTLLSGSQLRTVRETKPSAAPPSRAKGGSHVPLYVAGALLLVAALSALFAGRKENATEPVTTVAETATQSVTEAPAATVTVSESAEVTDTTTTTRSTAPPVTRTVPPSTTTDTPPPEPPPLTAEQLYQEGMARLIAREPVRAHAAFRAAVARDPAHARAHFRLGEMALFLRNAPEARRELNLALANATQLTLREKKLAELGIALLDRDRQEASQLLRELAVISPRDPDVERFRDLLGAERQRPRRTQPN